MYAVTPSVVIASASTPSLTPPYLRPMSLPSYADVYQDNSVTLLIDHVSRSCTIISNVDTVEEKVHTEQGTVITSTHGTLRPDIIALDNQDCVENDNIANFTLHSPFHVSYQCVPPINSVLAENVPPGSLPSQSQEFSPPVPLPDNSPGHFVEDSESMIISTIHMDNVRSRGRRTWRRNHCTMKQDDRSEMMATFSSLIQGSSILHECRDGAPFLRMAHVRRNGRTAALFTLWEHVGNPVSGNDDIRPYVGVLWQTSSRPLKSVCITWKRNDSPAAILPGVLDCTGTIVAKCTCTTSLIQNPTESACAHLSPFLTNSLLSSFISNILFTTFDDRHLYYGSPLQDARASSPMAWDLVPTPHPRSLPHLSQPITCSYSWWIAFERKRSVFVPLVHRKGLPLQCLHCRQKSSRRGCCSHEEVCHEAMRIAGIPEQVPYRSPSVAGDAEEHGFADPSAISTDPNKEVDYVTNKARRTLLMCSRELRDTRSVASKLQQCVSECALLRDRSTSTCVFCGTLRGNVGHHEYQRSMTLFTAMQGAPTVVVTDWKCYHCGTLNLFKGEDGAIFPFTKNTAYTTELLYLWTLLVCYRGMSFRDAYNSVRYMTRTVSSRLHTSTTKSCVEPWQRRRANDAFQTFLCTIDITCHTTSSVLFSCNQCETPLTPEDRRVLRIPSTLDCRRFQTLVIDGTTAGILRALPDFTNDHVRLENCSRAKPGHKLHSKVAHHPALAKAVKGFCDAARQCARICTQSRQECGKRTPWLFILHSDVLLLNLSKMLDMRTGSSSRSPTTTVSFLSSSQLEALLWFTRSTHCVCALPSPNSHDAECRRQRKLYNSTPNDTVIKYLLSSIALVGPFTELHHQLPLHGSPHSVSSPMESFHSTDMCALLSFQIRAGERQCFESALHLVSTLLTDHVLIPYITNMDALRSCSSYNTGTVSDHHITSTTDEEDKSLSDESFDGLIATQMSNCSQIAQCLLRFSACDHHGSSGQHWPCSDCTAAIRSNYEALRDVDPVLGGFLHDISVCTQQQSLFWRTFTKHLVPLLLLHMTSASNYAKDMDAAMHPSCRDYWNKYATPSMDALEPVPRIDAFSFPGRVQVRPSICFESGETHHCNKTYPLSKRHSPGILTVQCGCDNPKLIGYIVMTMAESTSLALSSVLTHFPVPPRCVVYDNACNMELSALPRVPWFLHTSKVVVDRFHYTAHKCSSFFDADCFSFLDRLKTTTAESINARIRKSANCIRYLHKSHYMVFLNIRFALLNLYAKYREKYARDDVDDEDIGAFFRSLSICPCSYCRQERPRSPASQDRDEITPTNDCDSEHVQTTPVATPSDRTDSLCPEYLGDFPDPLPQSDEEHVLSSSCDP